MQSEPAKVRRGQARGAATRERILEAVLELVGLEGPAAVTYRRVAESAGVAQGVMTYHFSSRRDLLSSAFRLHLERLRASAAELPLDDVADLSNDEKGELIYGFLRRMAREDRVRYLAEFELALELARDPELRGEVRPESDLTRTFASELLARAGSIDPDTDAVLISAVMEGLLLAWMAQPDSRQQSRRIRAAVNRLVELFFA